MKNKHIHFIGICGVAMSALAIALQKQGHKITGSDKGFYPPVSDNLRESNIDFYPGWHPEKMSKDGNPDLVVVGNVAGSKNPEWLYVQENNIPYKSYPEVVEEFLIKENSIVCAGTFGKSTNATLLSWILKESGIDLSYMFGGVALNNLAPAEITEGNWSVVEGDEYKTSRWDDKAKFFHYSPTHLLLTAAVWDHADIYPTKELYQQAFVDLVNTIPDTGVIVTNNEEKTSVEIMNIANREFISFGSKKADYIYKNINLSTAGTGFDIEIKATGETYHVQAKMLGDYIAKNFTGCFAMAHQVGIEPEKIVKAIESFEGVKRRLEKRLDSEITIYDDISHSPEKSRAVLSSLKQICTGKLYAVYEPNTGNRREASKPGYAGNFDSADIVIIPRLTKLKVDPNDPEPVMDGEELANLIKETQPNTKYFEIDDELVKFLVEETKKDDIIVFLGSHGFRGMIEEVCEKLQ